jgi:hypothetical protein
MKVVELITTVSPFAGISFVYDYFNKAWLSQLIDNKLGVRVKLVGF